MKATKIADFAVGDSFGMPIPGNPIASVIPAEIEGIVNRQDSVTELAINCQDVVIGAIGSSRPKVAVPEKKNATKRPLEVLVLICPTTRGFV